MSDRTSYGGQAVMEGVMMRGRRDMAIAVRAPSGEIAVYHEPLSGSSWTQRVRPLPLIRGVFMLWDTMVLGMRALVFSANVSLTEGKLAEQERDDAGTLTGVALWGTVAVSLLFSIGLFFVAPLAVVGFVDRYISSSVLSNLIEGLIRLGLLIGYMLFIGQLKDIRRVFGFHGAEHKAINAYEAGDPLDVEHVRRHSISHPRCGTGFLLIVVLLSILVFALLGRPPMFWRVVSRIVLVPFIAALAYEFIKWTANHMDNRLVRLLVSPSMALQRLTTREPDDGMIVAAIVSLKRVLLAEGKISADEVYGPGVVPVDETGRVLEPERIPVAAEPAIEASS
ncbi:DUF1385 domain-containing protein [Sphaerobacter thermophilus]|uniref:DUF1385 domain-containing protein n=1 Tax=Sphaerobacter thermophilus TaxID=2057 RepID=UPI00396D8A7E